jgi:Synaptobrevin
MSKRKRAQIPKLYSIGVFEDRILHESSSNANSNSNSIPMSLEEYEEFVDENGEFGSHIAAQKSDDLGTRLKLLGLLTDTSEVSYISKSMFKEFLLAGLRKIASAHQAHGLVNTYEFEAPRFGTFTAYAVAQDLLDRGSHRRIIAIIVTSGTYPRSLRMTVGERILNFTTKKLESNTPDIRTVVEGEIGKLIKGFYTPKNADKVHGIRADVAVTAEVMRGNVETLSLQGEQFDDLVDRSQDLSVKSKTFYHKAKKLNGVSCIIL